MLPITTSTSPSTVSVAPSHVIDDKSVPRYLPSRSRAKSHPSFHSLLAVGSSPAAADERVSGPPTVAITGGPLSPEGRELNGDGPDFVPAAFKAATIRRRSDSSRRISRTTAHW